MTVEQGVRKLVEGGWHMDDADTVLAELQTAGPSPARDDSQAVPDSNEEGSTQ